VLHDTSSITLSLTRKKRGKKKGESGSAYSVTLNANPVEDLKKRKEEADRHQRLVSCPSSSATEEEKKKRKGGRPSLTGLMSISLLIGKKKGREKG